MIEPKKRKVFRRGNGTIELPFLLSCALWLLDRRFWILGVRFPLEGIRFDVLAKLPSPAENVALVEAKYRGDGRPVRPSEIARFSQEVAKVRAALEGCVVRGFFMTNTQFSDGARRLATSQGILTFSKVPMLFDLRREGGREEKSKTRKEPENAHNPFSSNVSNRAGRRGGL